MFFIRQLETGIVLGDGHGADSESGAASLVLHLDFAVCCVARGAMPWQVLSVTVFAYYLFWNERLFLLPWHSEPWLRGFIFIPPVVAALFALAQAQAQSA